MGAIARVCVIHTFCYTCQPKQEQERPWSAHQILISNPIESLHHVIIRVTVDLEYVAYFANIMKVLFICHGRKHPRPKWLNLPAQAWQDGVYVDIDPKCDPDFCHDIMDMSFDAGSFDMIVAVYCPCSVPLGDGGLRRGFWTRVEAWLRPGGAFVMTVNTVLLCSTAHSLGVDYTNILRLYKYVDNNKQDLIDATATRICAEYDFRPTRMSTKRWRSTMVVPLLALRRP
jgi:hypothetical protein